MHMQMTAKRLLSSYVLVLALCFFAGAGLDAAYYHYFDPDLWQPAIVCDNPDHHFGKIAGGKLVPYEFAIRNVGNGPLEISKVKPGCGGCIKVVHFPKESIEPGEGGVIQVALITEHLDGLVHKNLAVLSNDAKHRALVLKLHAFVDNPAWAKEMAAKAAVKTTKKGTVPSSRQAVATGNTRHSGTEDQNGPPK
jgi:hypothetical protein